MRVLFDGFGSLERWILRRMLGNQLFEVVGVIDDLDDDSFAFAVTADSGREPYRGEIDFRPGSVSLSGRYGRGGVRFDEIPRARSWGALHERSKDPLDLIVTSRGVRPEHAGARVIDVSAGSDAQVAIPRLVASTARVVAPSMPHVHVGLALIRALQKTVGLTTAALVATDVPREFASGHPGRAAALPDTGGGIATRDAFHSIGALIERAGGDLLRDGVSGVEYFRRDAPSCVTLVLSVVAERTVAPDQLVRLIASETKRTLPKQFDILAGVRAGDVCSRSVAVLDTESIAADGSAVSFGVRLDPHAFFAATVTELAAM